MFYLLQNGYPITLVKRMDGNDQIRQNQFNRQGLSQATSFVRQVDVEEMKRRLDHIHGVSLEIFPPID